MSETSATLPAKLSSLPDSWVDRIFGRMEALYGSLFLDRWRGTDIANVKQVWADELAGFSDNPECFGKALAILTQGEQYKFPPTLPEFKAICRSFYQRPELPKLEHKLTPEDIERNRQRIAEIRETIAKKMGMANVEFRGATPEGGASPATQG